MYDSKSHKKNDIKANILKFECFPAEWNRDDIVDRIYINKKFTVSILEMLVELFGLSKVGDRKRLTEIVIDYLMHFRENTIKKIKDTERTYKPHYYNLFFKEQHKKLKENNNLLSTKYVNDTVAAQWKVTLFYSYH